MAQHKTSTKTTQDHMFKNGTFEGTLNVELFYQTLARIIGEKEGVKLTVTVRPKENLTQQKPTH